jgi:hypothetical protein
VLNVEGTQEFAFASGRNSLVRLLRDGYADFLELLEPDRQSVPIRAILTPPRQLDHLPDDPLEPEFEERAVMDFEQSVRDVNSVIRVDPDQVGVEGGVVVLR